MPADREIRLRKALADEADQLAKLCLRSKAIWGYDEAFLDACRAELRPAPDAIELGRVQVAEIGNTLAGLAEVSVDSRTAYLEKLFVDPEFIGQGVGARLMEWAKTKAASLGAGDMVIESDPGAAEFYRRQGAQDDGFASSKSIPGRMLPRLVLKLPARQTHEAMSPS